MCHASPLTYEAAKRKKKKHNLHVEESLFNFQLPTLPRIQLWQRWLTLNRAPSYGQYLRIDSIVNLKPLLYQIIARHNEDIVRSVRVKKFPLGR